MKFGGSEAKNITKPNLRTLILRLLSASNEGTVLYHWKADAVDTLFETHVEGVMYTQSHFMTFYEDLLRDAAQIGSPECGAVYIGFPGWEMKSRTRWNGVLLD